MWSKFAPVGVALAVGLQGCLFVDLPTEVRVAVGKSCEVAVENINDDMGLKKIAAIENGCKGTDAQKLKDLGVEDCPSTVHEMMGAVMMMECEEGASEAISEPCHEVSSQCKDILDRTLKAWVPEPIPDKDAEAEEKDGFEAVIGMVAACRDASKTFVDTEDESIAQFCPENGKAEDFETMGVTAKECPEYIIIQLTHMHTVFCTVGLLTSADPDTIDKKIIDDSVKEYFDALETDSLDKLASHLQGDGEVDRLRLFQTTMKSKKWPGRKSSLSKLAVFGGATLIALTALVAVGVRRYTREPAAEEQEMLEDIE